MKKKNSLSERTKSQYQAESNLIVIDPPFPKNIMIELSNACNHKCVFCTNPYMTRTIKRLDNEKLIKIIQDSFDCGARELGFYTTGEPFIYKNIDKIIKKSKEIGFEYTYISTNGALATPSKAKDVIEAGIDSIKFSINAFDKEDYNVVHGKDEWDLVLKNLKFISDYRKQHKKKFRLYVTSVITNITENKIRDFKKILNGLVDEIQLSAVHAQGGYMSKAYDLLKVSNTVASSLDVNFNQTKESDTDICTIPFNRLHVTCEGYLTACCVDYQNYLTVADLNVMSIGDAWRSEDFRKLREKHLTKKLHNTLCDNCWNNKCEKVAPLNNKLSTEIDEIQHSRDIQKKVLKKLHTTNLYR